MTSPTDLYKNVWETALSASMPAGFAGRSDYERSGDEIRIIPGVHIPGDYTTDCAPFINPILAYAQALGKKVIFPDTGNRYLPIGSPLVVTPGAQRSGGTTGAVLTDSSGVPLRNNVRIEGNNCTIVPSFTGFGIEIYPSYSLAEIAGNPSWIGYNSSQLEIANINFNLDGAPGAQALRIGRQGRTFRNLSFYSRVNNIVVG